MAEVVVFKTCLAPRCKNPALGFGYPSCVDHILEAIDIQLAQLQRRREWLLSKRTGQLSLVTPSGEVA